MTSAPRVLMLGKGWFPDQLGGLDRYYRDLLEQLPEARGIVIGAAPAPHERVTGVSDHERPLAQRLAGFWRASQRAAGVVDIVDAHFGLYALAPLWVGGLRHTPAILHFHGPWADENVAAGDRSGVRRQARRLLERAAYRRADEAVVLTSAFRKVLVERYGVRPWNVHVQPPGVDLARFAPGSAAAARRRLDLDERAFVAVAVRRLVPRMGLDVLLDAWAGGVADLPPGSTLLIVGDGPLRGELAERIGAGGLGASVRLLGRIADDELAELYRAADVGVVPTLEHEGFGLVVIEAAACGTPSIVTATGGLPETVAGLDPSLAVAPGDAEALRARLLRAVHDRPDRAACRSYAERHAWPAVAERHRAIARRAAGHAPRDERLKVVYVDHVAQMSGAEIALLRLLPHLDRVNPHVVLAQDGPLVEQLHLAGISVEVLPLAPRARDLRKAEVRLDRLDPAAAAATALYVLRLARRLRHLRPDLVHTNSLKAGVYGSLAARIAGIPVVWHVRDRIAGDYLPGSAVTLVRRMSRHLATAVVANSKATMATLEAAADPTVVYSVVPEVMNRVTPVDRRVNGGPMTYGMVGRLAPWKGQHLFLRAFAAAFPDGPERAVVVGGPLFGEDAYARELAGLAEALGIARRVEFRGFRKDVWEELSRLDVLVHASTIPEPFGQVVLEGMAAGVPVIAAGAGGPAEILDDGRTGILYEPNDAAALAGCMRSLLDPALRERLSAAARHEVRRYEPQVVAAELHRLYAAVSAASVAPA
jgi:glycosyltransferase involved in cell wall biosynthesis